MSKRIRVVLPVVALLASLSAPSVAGAAEPDVVISGGGWGHGIGMSQYGAKGMADEGKTAAEILNYFYDGTGLGTVGSGVPDPGSLWVGLFQNRTEVSFEAIGGSLDLCQANDGEGPCPTQTAAPGEAWMFKSVGSTTCQYFRDGVAVGNPGDCDGSITWEGQPDTRVKFSATGREYARGTIRFRAVPFNPSVFHTSLEIPVEEYLYGIDEVPSSWPASALQAQAIAARSYAVTDALVVGSVASNTGAQLSCWCHLFSDTRDQNYVGWAKESQVVGSIDYGALWKAAVDDTVSEVVTSAGSVVGTFYFSSTGGATENIEDVWNTSPRSYLVSKPDPWSQLPANPYGSWSKTIAYESFVAALGFDQVHDANITELNESGSPKSIEIIGIVAGVQETKSFSGSQFRSKFGLRSHYVTGIEASFPPVHEVQRLWGADRYATAAAISAATFPQGSDVVYVATGENYPDALAGGPAAATENAPILLVRKDSVPGATQQELGRLQPKRIVILGGTGVVTETVAGWLAGFASEAVERRAGPTRFETAVEISRGAFSPGVPVVYIVTGFDFPEAIVSGPAAAAGGGPLLLIRPTGVPGAVVAELQRLQPAHIVVVGGPAAVSETVLSSLRHYTSGSVRRISGTDRYSTGAAVSADAFDPGVAKVFVATGELFPDGLTGTPAAAQSAGPILLVTYDTIPAAVRTELARLQPTDIVLLGGTGALSETVEQALQAFLN
jgi:SpoIID/LytB domain protein